LALALWHVQRRRRYYADIPRSHKHHLIDQSLIKRDISPPLDGRPTLTQKMLTTFALALSALAGSVSALWPVPIQYSEGNTTVVLDPSFTIQFNGPSGAMPAGCVDTSVKIWAAIHRTYDLLNDGFIPDMLYTFEEDFEPTADEMADAPKLMTLVVTQKYAIP
jgi:hypothetical protein